MGNIKVWERLIKGVHHIFFCRASRVPLMLLPQFRSIPDSAAPSFSPLMFCMHLYIYANRVGAS